MNLKLIPAIQEAMNRIVTNTHKVMDADGNITGWENADSITKLFGGIVIIEKRTKIIPRNEIDRIYRYLLRKGYIMEKQKIPGANGKMTILATQKGRRYVSNKNNRDIERMVGIDFG